MSCGADVSGEQGNAPTVPLPTVPPAPDVLALLRQATLGEYDILGELGRGGMATVYLAHEIALNRKVAIKVMAPTLSLLGEGMVERFKREARTAAGLSHPHIIPIHAVRESAQLLYFVMKFVPGRSLDSVIRELGPLPIPMVQAILIEVGGALGYAHRQGVVHRDVKPANIMIDEEGWAMITDFGIAKASDAQGLTMTGITVGTPTYMSPEQCASKAITGASDQYALGVVAYEMLSGRTPFNAETIMALMYAHLHEPPTPIQEVRPDCPVELATAVMRMLEKEPEQRFPTMAEAVTAIGGQSPREGDPVRMQLQELAKTGTDQNVLRQLATPASPAPRGSSRGARTAPARGAASARSGRPAAGERRSRGLVTGLVVAVLVVAGGVVAVTQYRRERASPSPKPPPAQAMATHAPAPAPGQGPSGTSGGIRSSEPSPPVPQPSPPPRTATAKPVSKAPASSQPANAPTGGPAASPTAPPVKGEASPPRDRRAEVSGLLTALSQAIEARDLDRLRALWLRLPPKAEQSWARLFQDPRVRAVHAQFELRDLTANGDTLDAQVTRSIEVRRLFHTQSTSKAFGMRLIDTGEGVKILSSKEEGEN